MQNRPKTGAKTLALVIGTAALTVACAIFFAPQFTQSIAARDTQKISDRVPQAVPATTLDTTAIAPADVLGTGVISWAPLTGDGSN